MEQEYYLGLDMGTGSVGWAVTDSEYHVLRKHGRIHCFTVNIWF